MHLPPCLVNDDAPGTTDPAIAEIRLELESKTDDTIEQALHRMEQLELLDR